MAFRASLSRRAASRSQSTTCRSTPRGAPRRGGPGGGGKGRGGPPTPAPRCPPLPLPPDQVAVRQHHGHGVPVEPRPQSALVLVPAQQPLGLLVVPLHPVPPVGILDH